MAGYRGRISYIYAYEARRKREKTFGFASWKQDGQCRLSINVKMLCRGQCMGVYLLSLVRRSY